MREVRFGIIGAGLMGREFASAAARWSHLTAELPHPVVTAVCDTNPELHGYFTGGYPSVTFTTTDHRELLARDDVDAVYCAVPHHLHARLYGDIIRAGKHLLGEKPFGIDRAANAEIGAVILAHPDVLVRCASEFPFFPGAQAIFRLGQQGAFGEIIEVEAGFLHSSDLDPGKPSNWKRRAATNGEYGCLGDLGMHVLHLPLRLGFCPDNVRALLSKIVTERPDGRGGTVPCDTWDNATLATTFRQDGRDVPMLLHTKRISPGDTNTWFLRVTGTRLSAEFSTRRPRTLRTLPYAPGGVQAWQEQDLGYASAYPTITGGIFEFGFTDAILQMWAAFLDELGGGTPAFGCVTPEEAHFSHELFTAALESQRRGEVVALAGTPTPDGVRV